MYHKRFFTPRNIVVDCEKINKMGATVTEEKMLNIAVRLEMEGACKVRYKFQFNKTIVMLEGFPYGNNINIFIPIESANRFVYPASHLF